MKLKFGISKGILSLALVAGIHQGANATTLAFRATAQANAGLIHQWGFDGADVTTAGLDLEGTTNLTERKYGTGGAIPIGYDVSGWDATSKAFTSNRQPGSDSTGGGYLKAENATPISALGLTFSFEIIVRPDQASITGGLSNLGYILSNRSADNNHRGYFLVQGQAPLPAGAHPFSSTIGNGYNVSNTNIITSSPLTPGDWYYVAGSYTAASATGPVTWTNYFANLTAGGPLTTVGPFTNAGNAYAIGSAREFGIGGRYDGQEAFPGSIDEVNLYNTALSAADFQSNFNALTIPEPSTFAFLSLGLVSLLRRRRTGSAV